MNEKFYTASVFNDITNNKFEGEIKNQGDKVYIRTIPDVTIKDYVKGQVLEIEHPDSPPIELLIDKAHYFNVSVDDIDAYQSDLGLMEMWSKDATEQMRNHIDSGVLQNVYADVDSNNQGDNAGKKSGAYDLGTAASAKQIDKDNILDFIVDMGTVLDEQDVPADNRWIVAPAWFTNMIKKSDLQDASLSGDGNSILRNGLIGMIDRFKIYMSNNVHFNTSLTQDSWQIMAGHKSAITFANQIVKVENIKSERTFANLVRGLNVYGYKVVVPESLVLLRAIKETV